MKNLCKHTSSAWVRYSKYEWKKDNITLPRHPMPMPKIYDPLKDYKPMVLDALNIGLMIRISSKRKVREAIMNFFEQLWPAGFDDDIAYDTEVR